MKPILLILLIAAPTTAAETDYPPLPKPVTSFGAAVSDGYVYLYGGHSGKAHSYSTATTLGQFLRLNISKPVKWEELSGGPSAQGVAVVAHGGKIYRIGGMQPRNKADEKTDAHSLAGVACFDPKTKKWDDLPDLPEGRSSHDAVVLGDKIYVAGGWKMNGSGGISDWHANAVMLDLKKQPLKWESFEQPFKRRALTMAAFDGKIYVIAGLNEEGSAERTVNVFDPDKKSWSNVAQIPNGVMNGFTPAACVLDGRLYLSPADGKLYRLSEDGKAWPEVATLKLPRMVHRVVPIAKNQMLAIGGSAKGSPSGDVELIAPAK